MWNNGEDVNDCGEAIELYLPVQAPPRKTNIAPQDSHIGGLPYFGESFTPCCEICGDKMFLLAQVKKDFSAELERYLCVFSCAKEECYGEISFDKGFASSAKGLKGVVKCIEKTVPIANSESKAKQPISTPNNKSSWYDDNDDDKNNDDDWGMGGDDDANINLESAVAAMEGKLDDGGAIVMESSKKSTSKAKSMSADEALKNAYGCYILTTKSEPPSSKSFYEDEDDVGLSESDEKIRNMLARYMAEEEDEEILAALGGTSLGGGGGGGNNGEEDERLSEEDRVLRTFQDRQKRAPRQVIRYASGGKPLWSIPDKNRKSGKTLWSAPESVRFELQVLPSILAALEVDQHPSTRAASTEAAALDQLLTNGVNFGSLAIFTDPSSCDGEREAFVVIQKSVDDLPEVASKAAASGEGLPTASMAVVEDLDDDEEFQLDA